MDRHRKSPWVPESGSWEGGRGEAVAASSVQAGRPASPWSTTARSGVRLSVRPCPRSRPSWEHRERGAVLLAPGRSADLAATSLLRVHAGPRAVSELLRCTHSAAHRVPNRLHGLGLGGAALLSPLRPPRTSRGQAGGTQGRDEGQAGNGLGVAAGRAPGVPGREQERGQRRGALEQGRDCSAPHAHAPPVPASQTGTDIRNRTAQPCPPPRSLPCASAVPLRRPLFFLKIPLPQGFQCVPGGVSAATLPASHSSRHPRERAPCGVQALSPGRGAGTAVGPRLRSIRPSVHPSAAPAGTLAFLSGYFHACSGLRGL